jgi:hypothetical protein
VRVIEPMGELEFSAQAGDLGQMPMLLIEHLQGDRTIRALSVVRLVHGCVPAVAEGRLDDVALKPVAGGKHLHRLRFASLGQPLISVLWYLPSWYRR